MPETTTIAPEVVQAPVETDEFVETPEIEKPVQEVVEEPVEEVVPGGDVQELLDDPSLEPVEEEVVVEEPVEEVVVEEPDEDVQEAYEAYEDPGADEAYEAYEDPGAFEPSPPADEPVVGRRLLDHDPYRADYYDTCNCYGNYNNCECNGTAEDYGVEYEPPYGQPYQSPYQPPYQPPYQQPYQPPYQPPYQQPYQPQQPFFPPVQVPIVLPPPPSPIIPSPPPPPPPVVELPPDMNGIWYFAVRPLSKKESSLQTAALKSTNGESTMKESLAKSGINVITVLQARYAGPEIDGSLDVTRALDLDQLVGEGAESDEDSGLSAATIGIIVGCVAGGLALIALIIALLISHKRRSERKDRDSLTNQWKIERELAANESKRLSDISTQSSIQGSLRWTASQGNSFKTSTTMTRDELERRRSLRASASLATSQRLEDGSAMADQSPQKVSRLDSMRNALGLSRSTKKQSSGVGSPSSALGEATAESSQAPKWNLFTTK